MPERTEQREEKRREDQRPLSDSGADTRANSSRAYGAVSMIYATAVTTNSVGLRRSCASSQVVVRCHARITAVERSTLERFPSETPEDTG